MRKWRKNRMIRAHAALFYPAYALSVNMMTTGKKTKAALFSIVAIAFVLGLAFWPMMPEKMASHWNAAGEVDGYLSRFWGLFLIPMILAVLIALFLLFPEIDPLRKNFKKFRKYYDGFIISFSVFMLFIYLHSALWNIGIKLPANIMVPAIAGILFFYLGSIMGHLKRNWIIGIRTPWTLFSDKVWKKTHKIGGELFKAAGIVALAGMFFREHAIYFVIIPVLAIVAFGFVYSYLQYKR